MEETSLQSPSESTGVTSQRKILTVSELTRDIKTLLETGFDSIWVKGEISSFKVPSSGHFYFNLKDEKSMLACVMFKFKNQYLKFELKDGLEVICGGRITLYEPRGSYQLLVETIEPKGLGALQLRFEQLKEKLSKEGLFSPEHKKPLPYLPQKIALITSPTGAAIQDMLNILNRRFSNLEILLVPVSVQGDKAAPEITRAIELVNQMNEHDVIIVGRGGGSLEDLWAFNEEIVARAVFASHIPIISAVGHEIDFTICDFVADLRAPTPSAAAELVVKNKIDLQKNILSQLNHLRQAFLTHVTRYKKQLAELSGRIIDPRRKLEDWRLRLSDLQERLHYTLLQNVKNAKSNLENLSPKLSSQIHLILERHRHHITRLKSLLKSLNPLAILERGFSITKILKTGHILRKSSEAKQQDMVSIELSSGKLMCEIKEIKN
ncbi:MAG: hypothetical protein A2Z91_03225 [Deltaproteobacteria bacterium GWA2_38_16]|nr:MAG: hypothetical protein A2Z91_03225 [Deltaproteobacteria bacterium GWA2_38_16]OGQ02897.1 MAG: hypothetical protein A3D19_06655 [Deltaproteobacteria bacterium RIFCSPHIGHO2_02_FULL_38_15]HBQ21744.1 exodeoxyribonuclease VII large subunit [Deltaproteobacteria bacterium]